MAFKAPKPSKKPFEFAQAPQAEYDWGTLLNGEDYECKRGEHFGCKAQTFGTMARNQAKKRNKTIKVSVDEEAGTVRLRATDMTEAEIAEHEAKVAERKAKKEAEAEGEGTEDTEDTAAA